jgi:hypothetical protein
MLHLFCIAAPLSQAVAAQQICAFDLLDIGGKDDLYMFSFPPFVQRADAEVFHNSVVKSGPMFACHAAESALIFAAMPQLKFAMGMCGVGAAGALLGALASAVFRFVKKQSNFLNEQLPAAGDKREHAAGEAQFQLRHVPLIVTAQLLPEQLPGIGEFVPQIEQTPAGAGQIALAGFLRAAPQPLSAFPRCVKKIHHYVAQGFQIEEVVFRGQFNSPPANSPVIFKWKIAFVAEIDFKQACVVLAA